jgi:hypothetical protein
VFSQRAISLGAGHGSTRRRRTPDRERRDEIEDREDLDPKQIAEDAADAPFPG